MTKKIDEDDLMDMMFASENIDTFKSLWEHDKDLSKWSEFLQSCYWEESYESVGGDEGYLENPPINHKRLEYLKSLIAFLEGVGIQAENDAP